MGRNLTNLYISESFNYIMQVSGSNVQNGLGASLSGSVLDLHVVSASNAVSASYANIASLANSATTATTALTASYTPNAIETASAVASTITFTKGNGTTFDVTVAQSGSVDSASYATYAATAGTATTATSASYVLGSNVDGTVANATDAVYAQNTVTTGKNLEATEIAKGTPLYFTGSGTAGNLVGIYRADAGNPLRMPAGGVAGEAIASGAEGVVLLDGFINGVNTSAFAAGEKVYVGVGGGYTNVEPTGSANLIQYLGNVEKSAVNGSGVIQMMGEARRLPNLQQNYLWKGGAGDVPQAVAESSLSVASAVSSSHAVQADNANTATSASHALVSDTVNDANVAYINQNNVFTGTQTFNNITVNGTGSFAYIQSVTGSAKIIGDAFIILNNDLPTERYAGIVVQDSGSGSPLTTASLQFDGQTNDWFYEYSNDGGVTTDHGVVIFGPEYDTKGTPTYLTSNTIPKSSGSHHIVDSNISDSGTVVKINSNTQITGSTEIRLSGAQSLKAFKPGFGTFSTTGGDITATAGPTQVAVATPYAGTLEVRNTSTGDDFGLAGDMSQFGFLGDWTGPGIFANDPSDNYPTIIGFQNKSSWTDGSVTFLTPVYSNANMIVSSSTGFPLEVNGTMNTRRIHFDKNPFNDLQNGTLGAIRMDSTNKSFYSTLYNDTYNQASQSKFIAELDTTSSFSATTMEADYGGTIGSFEVRNDNGVRTSKLITDSYIITGSVRGEVNALSIASTTASLDASTGNFFTLALVDGADTHVDASNIKPGQTYILRSTNGASGTGTVSFAPEFKFAGGTAPTGSAGASAVDVFTFVSFDSTNVFATAVQNLS